MFVIVLWNFSILFLLCAVIFFPLFKKYGPNTDSLSWKTLTFAYCVLLIAHSIAPLPLPAEWRAASFEQITSSLQWNPFAAILNDWKQVKLSLHSTNPHLLLQFCLRYVGNFLLYMPLANVLYASCFTWNRRKTQVVVLGVALLTEGMDLLLFALTGDAHYRFSLGDVLTKSLGSALFLFLSFCLPLPEMKSQDSNSAA